MSGEAAHRAPMLCLREVVDRYLAAAGSFGRPVALSSFGLTPSDTQALFSMFDEDYHISRFLHFSCSDGESFVISGDSVTHVTIDPEISSIL
jgi:hypothetical protein